MKMRDSVAFASSARAEAGMNAGGRRLLRDDEIDGIAGGCEPLRWVVDHTQFTQTANYYRHVQTGHFVGDVACISPNE